MKRKVFQIALKIILAIIVVFIINNMIGMNSVSHAASLINLNKFPGNDSTGSEGISESMGSILYVIQVIAVGVATIMLVVLAIKYMVSSVSERAELKKHMVIYVLGAILMFGASGIVELIKNFATEI